MRRKKGVRIVYRAKNQFELPRTFYSEAWGPQHYCEKNKNFIARSSIISSCFPVKLILQKETNFLWGTFLKLDLLYSLMTTIEIEKPRVISEDEGAIAVFDDLLDYIEKAIDPN